MNITITDYQALSLAEHFANVIHAEVINMQLRVTWGIWPVDLEHAKPTAEKQITYSEMQAAIRSIKNPSERRMFILQVRRYFTSKCMAHGTRRKWQDYVAGVTAAYADHKAKLAAYERCYERAMAEVVS